MCYPPIRYLCSVLIYTSKGTNACGDATKPLHCKCVYLYHCTTPLNNAVCNSITAFTILCHFAGKFKATDLIAFLSEQAGSTAAGKGSESEESEGSNSQQEKKEEKQDPQIVRDLNLTQYESLTDEEDAWLVGFYSGVSHSSPAPRTLTRMKLLWCTMVKSKGIMAPCRCIQSVPSSS